MPMSWKIPVSPIQRVTLFNLLCPRAAEIADAAQGRIFRKTWRNLGLKPIDDASIVSKRGVNAALASSQTPALHEISIDMADYLFDKVVNKPRFPGEVLQLGNIFDAIDQIRDKKESWEGGHADGIPDYIVLNENWAPAELDPRGKLIQAMAFMADAPETKRAETWKSISESVGGAEKLNVAMEALVDEVRAAVAQASAVAAQSAPTA